MEKKEKLNKMLHRADLLIQQAAGSLSEAERSSSGTSQGWGARDNLAHAAMWIEHLTQRIHAWRTGEAEPPAEREFQDRNEEFFNEMSAQLWERFAELIARAEPDLLAELEFLSEADLTAPGLLPGLGDRPLFREIYGQGYSHALLHIGLIFEGHGQSAFAMQLYEEEAQTTQDLDEGSEIQGTALYNLACHYALAGMREPALAQLPLAFKLYPYLIEWSEKDSDLVSLHQDAEFLEILEAARDSQAEAE